MARVLNLCDSAAPSSSAPLKSLGTDDDDGWTRTRVSSGGMGHLTSDSHAPLYPSYEVDSLNDYCDKCQVITRREAMLIKEYRILLPLSVDEYRIAQLYMIQKKSRLDTSGAGSGVEIIKNEPYVDGPGGEGQYTYKIFHIGSHIPTWIRSVMPATALQAHEEAWNAYPYTKTRYSCPFMDRFVVEVETRYFDDAGTRENVFGLNKAEIKQRIVDYMDFVKDPISSGDYCLEEDPKLYVSEKTGRGPLSDDWAEQHSAQKKPIMCAYKLCRVEFRYWGMQTRVERWIHELALRKTMLRAHRQAWAWQDEWYSLTMDDIRQLEKDAQDELKRFMDAALRTTLEDSQDDSHEEKDEATQTPGGQVVVDNGDLTPGAPHERKPSSSLSVSSQRHRLVSQRTLTPGSNSPTGSLRSAQSAALKERFEGIRSDSEDSDSLYFDCIDRSPSFHQKPAMIRWSSNLLLGQEDDDSPPLSPHGPSDCVTALLVLVFHGGSPFDVNSTPKEDALTPIDAQSSKVADVQTLRSTMAGVIRAQYPQLNGRVAVHLVPCQNVVAETLGSLATLSPYGGDAQQALGEGCCHPPLVSLIAAGTESFDHAVGAAIARANQAYATFLASDEGRGFSGEVYVMGDAVGGLIAYESLVRTRHHVLSRNPSSVSGQSDIVSAIPEEGGMCNESGIVWTQDTGVDADSLSASSGSPREIPARPASVQLGRHRSTPPAVPGRRHGRSSSETDGPTFGAEHLTFKVVNLFLCGAPLGPVLVHRRISQFYSSGEIGLKVLVSPVLEEKDSRIDGLFSDPPPVQPSCSQVFNMFYPVDPCAARLEPLLCRQFARLSPTTVPRYHRMPQGDGQSELIADHVRLYQEELVGSDIPANGATVILQAVSRRWWGTKRIDHALYCPDGLAAFPLSSLPGILHASYWESSDVVAFLLRQFVIGDNVTSAATTVSFASGPATLHFNPSGPTGKWNKKRTSFKIKNASGNHRANDVIAIEGSPQVLVARFCYGPIDMVALSGEKVDIFVANAELASSGEWLLYGTEETDGHGRLNYQFPPDKCLSVGVHPVKMVVHGDHSYCDLFMAVVPRETECVVFSIDGSFTASMSVTGKDPKVRAGAVDVVRHWQELGYLILYVTARPDMQQRQVSAWLAQHNFPHGLLFFTGSLLSTDPLRQKTLYLKQLVESGIRLQAAYGSAKDVQMYTAVGVDSDRTFIVGRKVSKKLTPHAHCIIDSYSAHLLQLTTGPLQAIGRPAHGNGRLTLRKGFFSLPGQFRAAGGLTVQRSQSFTPRSGKYESQSGCSSPHSPPADSLASPGPKTRGLSPFRALQKR
uniref:DDHD domain-containing protein n=1 Tax=Plectus sambesii TaxID=2011161 RepID=A0A914VVA9_9BILA